MRRGFRRSRARNNDVRGLIDGSTFGGEYGEGRLRGEARDYGLRGGVGRVEEELRL